jgi:hypothetical protein
VAAFAAMTALSALPALAFAVVVAFDATLR